jgi:hypothetical protein
VEKVEIRFDGGFYRFVTVFCRCGISKDITHREHW